MTNIPVFFITIFLKNKHIIHVLYTYCSFFVSVFFAIFFKCIFLERYRIIPVRMLTVLYTYRILLTMLKLIYMCVCVWVRGGRGAPDLPHGECGSRTYLPDPII